MNPQIVNASDIEIPSVLRIDYAIKSTASSQIPKVFLLQSTPSFDYVSILCYLDIVPQLRLVSSFISGGCSKCNHRMDGRIYRNCIPVVRFLGLTEMITICLFIRPARYPHNDSLIHQNLHTVDIIRNGDWDKWANGQFGQGPFAGTFSGQGNVAISLIKYLLLL